LVNRGARKNARNDRNPEKERNADWSRLFWGALKPCEPPGQCRSTAREEADNSPLFQPRGEAMEDCSRGKSAGALSQLRMDTDASRKGVPEEFTGTEEAQAKRPVSSTF
jgi:hypothetical protein